MGKNKGRYSFAGTLKAIENTMEFSYPFILQLRPLTFGPGLSTLLMIGTSRFGLALFF